MALLKKKNVRVRDALLLGAITPSIKENRTSIEADEDVCRVVHFTDYLSEVDIGWLDKVLNQADMPVCIRLDPSDVTLLKDGVDQHMSQVTGMQLSARRASQQDEYERELRHGRDILRLVGDSGEKFFNVSVSAVLRARTPEQLERDTSAFRSTVKSAGMNFLAIPNNQLAGWFGSSPLRSPDPAGVERTQRPMPSTTVGYSRFATATGLDDSKGITIGPDSRNGLVRLNILERTDYRPNSNIMVIGTAGSGKTTLTMKLLEREYLQYGSKIIIVDPEGEYASFVRKMGGDVIKINAASAAKLSPLEPRAVSFNSEEIDIDERDDAAGAEMVLMSTIPFAKSWFRRAFEIPVELLDSLEVALVAAYARYGITKETSFAEYYGKGLSYPIMEDVYDAVAELKDKDPDRRDQYVVLEQKVHSAAKGINSPLWNVRTSLDISADLVCIDTSDMDSNETLKQAQYYNITSWIWSQIRLAPASNKHIRVVFDEASIIVNKKTVEAADMVKTMVKRIRKRNGGTTITTQEMNDFLDDEIHMQGAAICNNATYKFIGNAEGDNLRRISELYSIDPELQKRIERAPRGDFALFAGALDRTWVKVDVADWELALFDKTKGL